MQRARALGVFAAFVPAGRGAAPRLLQGEGAGLGLPGLGQGQGPQGRGQGPQGQQGPRGLAGTNGGGPSRGTRGAGPQGGLQSTESGVFCPLLSQRFHRLS